MTNTISPISFHGLKINGTISVENIQKLGKFANAAENKGFIKDLEKLYNTDMILNGELNEVGFAHKDFGDLSKYGLIKFPVKDFYSNVVFIMDNIKTAVKKAEKEFIKSKGKDDVIPRGC